MRPVEVAEGLPKGFSGVGDVLGLSIIYNKINTLVECLCLLMFVLLLFSELCNTL